MEPQTEANIADQMAQGYLILFDALTALLILSSKYPGNPVTPEDVFNFIADKRAGKVNGSFCKALTDAPMRGILEAEFGSVEAAPEIAKKVLSGELVPQRAPFEVVREATERRDHAV